MNINFEKLNTIARKHSLALMSAGDSIFIILEEYLDAVQAPKHYSLTWNGGSGVIALLKGENEVDNYHFCQVDKISYKNRSVTFTTGDTIYFM